MTFIPTNIELGLPEDATVEQRAAKIAELSGYRGLGSVSQAYRFGGNGSGVKVHPGHAENQD